MKADWIKNLTSASYALLLHIVLIGLFVFGMAPSSTPKPPASPKVDIVQAKVLNEADILKEVQRQQELEDNKRNQEKLRQEKIDNKLAETQKELARKEQEYLDQQERAKLEKQKQEEKIKKLEQERQLQEQKTREAEKLRLAEEEKQRVAEQQRKVEEEKKLKAEQARKAEEEKRQAAEAERKAEEQRKAEAEKARKLEEEKKRQAEEARKAEEAKKLKAEQDRIAEEKRRKDAEAKAKAAEAAQMLQESLLAEQQEKEQGRIAGVIDKYKLIIMRRVRQYWIRPAAAQSGLEATIKVSLLPSGDVKRVTIVQGSGNPLFDRSAENAVYKAAPFSMPTDPKVLREFREFKFIFKPE